MKPIRIPSIYCPFPAQISPYVEAVHEHSLAWTTRFHLIQKPVALRRFLASRFAWLTTRAYHSAGLEELKLMNDWLVWLFLFDDQFDDSQLGEQPKYLQALLNDYSAIITNPRAAFTPSPAAEAIADLCQRSFSHMSTSWRERYTQHFITYLDTYNWTVNNRMQGSVPSLDAYIEMRRHSGGLTMAIDLIDLAVGLPEYLSKNPEFELLHDTTNDAVCWSNDIISLQKELARGDVNNLVIVIQHAYGLQLQEAVDRVNEMITARVQLFERTVRNLPTFAPELETTVQKHLNILKGWMRGNLDWSAETYRYSHIESTLSGESVGYLEDILAIPPDSLKSTAQGLGNPY